MTRLFLLVFALVSLIALWAVILRCCSKRHAKSPEEAVEELRRVNL